MTQTELHRGYKHRLYPTHKQEGVLRDWTYQCRMLFNAALQEREDCYAKTGKSISCFDQYKSLTVIREDEDYKKLPVAIQRGALKKVDNAFQNFFREIKKGNKKSYPKYKGRHHHNTILFPTNDGFSLFYDSTKYGNLKSYVNLAKLGRVRFKQSRMFADGFTFTNMNVHEDSCGHWWVSFGTKFNYDVPTVVNQETTGIDLGLLNLVTTSDGEVIPPTQALVKNAKALRRAQRKLARAQKGSNNRIKKKLVVAKLHRKVARTRKYENDVLSKRLTEGGAIIKVEDLKVSNMMKNHKLAKAIADAGWGQLIQMIDYKSKQYGGGMIKVAPHNTSKTCSHCGCVKAVLKLHERIFICGDCGYTGDRDYNAALNIKNKAGKVLTELTQEITPYVSVKLTERTNDDFGVMHQRVG